MRDAEAAARLSIVLARVQLELRESAVAKGCLRRAASLLEDRRGRVRGASWYGLLRVDHVAH